MKWFRWIWLVGTLALLGEAFYQGMYVAPTEATMGDIQRIFYYHAPTAMMTFVFLFISFAASVAYLFYRHREPLRAMSADALALAGAEVGVLYCTIVLIQGMLWARPVWGIWWTWDARLTSALILWLIYSSYLLVRRLAAGPQMQTLAAMVAIFGYVDVPIVYFSTTWWRTQHPGPVVSSGNLDKSMWPAFLLNIVAWLAWGLMLIALRYAIERKRQLREQDEALRALEATLEATPWKENE
ncbi:MAG TPA: cytochrome c biogenesis protein CcsA [Acidobacteriaceae bacterium]